MKSAEEQGLQVSTAEQFEAIPGHGVRAVVDRKEFYMGGPAMLRRLNVAPAASVREAAERAAPRGQASVYLLTATNAVAAFAVADAVRPESRDAIQRLHDQGIEVVMLTGDAKAVANAVAQDLGIDTVFAEVLPGDKVDKVKELKSRGKRVAMVGDGVNDAPALVTADVAIAIGAGTDVAVEAGDVVLVRSDPRDVPRIIALSRASYRKMVQNLWWAAGYNVFAIPLAAGVLANQGILLPPAFAAVLMSASTVIVALNAQLLRRCPKCGMALEAVDVAPATKVEWTCPMHPEIVRDEPGSCPICGMALEARTVTLEETNPELEDMTRRFRWSALITLPILAFMVSEFFPGRPLQRAVPHGWMNWIQLALATPVVLWGGWPFFVRGWASIVNRHLNMFTLIALGVGAAWAYSVVATLAPGLFPDSFRMMGEVAIYFEPAAVIVVLVLLGQVLELRARSQTSTAIRNLLGLAPKTARRVESDGTERDVPLEHVQVGDRLRVRPGERVPVDGVVIDGTTTIDESMVTGEPIPVEKAAESNVTGGTVNGTGTFVMEARRVGSDTLLAQIVRMVSRRIRNYRW